MLKILDGDNLYSLLLVGLMAVLAVGCVSNAKHQMLHEDYEGLTQQKISLEESCEANAEQLIKQIGDLGEERADLLSLNQEMADQAERLVREKDEKAIAMQDLVFSLEQKLAGEEARITVLENSLRIEVIDKLMFTSGSATVTRRGSKILAKIAPTLLAATDNDIIIVGHTDELPPSAKLARDYPSNWELSAARAASIVHILTWNYKVPPTRMVIQGAAHYHPLITPGAKTKTARKNNRVVEIILKPKGN